MCPVVSPALAAGLPLAVTEAAGPRNTDVTATVRHAPPTPRRDFFASGSCCPLATCRHTTHAQKNRARRVLVAFKRANMHFVFWPPCPMAHDRTAAPVPSGMRACACCVRVRVVGVSGVWCVLCCVRVWFVTGGGGAHGITQRQRHDHGALRTSDVSLGKRGRQSRPRAARSDTI
jgi:hypothetical protein